MPGGDPWAWSTTPATPSMSTEMYTFTVVLPSAHRRVLRDGAQLDARLHEPQRGASVGRIRAHGTIVRPLRAGGALGLVGMRRALELHLHRHRRRGGERTHTIQAPQRVRGRLLDETLGARRMHAPRRVPTDR